MMNLPAIAAARLISQQIEKTKYTKVKDLVNHMGAIQAQDYAMAQWAIGLRLSDIREKQIEKALDKAEIIRTHVLRPTWHIVSATDIYWMLELSANKIKSLMKTMDKQLALTEKIYNSSNVIIEKCLGKGKHLTREELSVQLNKAGIRVNDNRLSHLLIRAELDKIVCNGKMEGNKRTYALLLDRVPNKKIFSREESLALLAKKYFTGHGPATAEDFSWWSGLAVKEAKLALELASADLESNKINNQTYWFSNDRVLPTANHISVQLLPAYDEFIIGYKDREASLAKTHHKKVLGINGIFNPVIIVNGQVTGKWKRTVQKDKIIIRTEFFRAHNKAIQHLIEEKASLFGQFTGQRVELLHGPT